MNAQDTIYLHISHADFATEICLFVVIIDAKDFSAIFIDHTPDKVNEAVKCH